MLESWEAGARTLITVASHADYFAIVSFALLQKENFSSSALRRLLEASGRAACHSAALSLSTACEILHIRRDATLDAGKMLTSAFKDTLRSAPLNAPELFGGLIDDVVKADQHRLWRLRNLYLLTCGTVQG